MKPADLYDPKILAQLGPKILADIQSQLERSQLDAASKPQQWLASKERVARAKELLERHSAQSPIASTTDLAQEYLQGSIALHSPNNLGHQVAPPLPLASIFETIGSMTNQAMGVYETGPFATAAERALSAKLCSYLGWNETHADAICTHGGSLGNLTALLSARNSRIQGSWAKGLGASSLKPAILTSADSHYSIARAAGIAGIGAEQVIKVSLDSGRRMLPEALEQAFLQARSQGMDPFCVVGTAGTTPVGAIDPLPEIAEVARRNHAWFHADGAHGASLLLSRKHRAKLKGIDEADTVVWDAHKMMYVPALCTFVLFKDKRRSFETFDQDAPYLIDAESEAFEIDSAVRTLECTKRPLAMATFAAWVAYGPEVFETLMDKALDTTQRFHELLLKADDFAPCHVPETNILCFEHRPRALAHANPEKISQFQATLRRKSLESGEYYITTTKLDGRSVLRVTIMNPLTEHANLAGLLAHLRALGKTILH